MNTVLQNVCMPSTLPLNIAAFSFWHMSMHPTVSKLTSFLQVMELLSPSYRFIHVFKHMSLSKGISRQLVR